ncbi:hypothetical protein SK128_011431 [Halocaridina rubra]|uniref:Uncharacterized protein n=1 Tax=Halocaridina rubra TaxID=373956 RepID=A0AAN8XNU6_HALRR
MYVNGRNKCSVQSGVVNKGVARSVMEDGTSHAPIAARCASSAITGDTSNQRKSNSLPGYFSRSHHQHPAPQSFRDAFNISKSPTPPHQNATQSLPCQEPASPRFPKAPTMLAQQQQYQQHCQQKQHHSQKIQVTKLPKSHHILSETHKEDSNPQKQQQNAQQKDASAQHQSHHKKLQKSRQPQSQSHKQIPEKQPSTEKKKRSILSGLFRRRKKEASSNSSSSSNNDSEEPSRRNFLHRRSKKRSSKEQLPPTPPPPCEDYQSVSTSNDCRHLENELHASSIANRSSVRVIVDNSNFHIRELQPLGIPLSPLSGHNNRREVSASHDSLSFRSDLWGNRSPQTSLGYHSGGGMGIRSSSTDTISKKERREALKARVEKLRDKFKDTSSDEDKASVSSHSMYGSESSLGNMNSNSLKRRSRAARTERFLRRKSQELETLRTETEKDRRNREVVQARIKEIQRIREYEAEKNKMNEEKKMQPLDRSKPKWSAKLVYQESSEYESSVLLQTPTASPGASPHMQNKFEGHIPQAVASESKSKVIMRNKVSQQSPATTSTLMPSYISTVRRSFQDFETPIQGDLRGHRSASYDSNINRCSLAMRSAYGNSDIKHSGTGYKIPNRSGLIPPAPPPRDRSRIVSPCDGRPMSFSFENITQEIHHPSSCQSTISNFTKGASPSPSVRSVPAYFVPKTNGQALDPHTLMVPTRRSFSELHLSHQDQHRITSDAPPARPAPPAYPNISYRYTDQPPKSQPSSRVHLPTIQPQPNNPSFSSVQFHKDQPSQFAKIVPVTALPPPPCEYSTAIVDENKRLQQTSTGWYQKEQEYRIRHTPSQNTQVLSDSSRSNSPKIEKCNGSGTINPSFGQQNDKYGSIQSKCPHLPSLAVKQDDSLSSLSGQSDVSSPIPKGIDSDSSQSSLAKEKKMLSQTRPLSMVLEKSESGEKESPPDTPKSQPQPPKRCHQQVTANPVMSKRYMFQEMMKQKIELSKEKTAYHKEFEEIFKKEKERLENSQCNNFEEALKELEEIYESLKLDSEDLLDRAERRDLPLAHQMLKDAGQEVINDSTSEAGETDSTIHCRSRSKTPRSRRSGIPDKKADDMHYRRCQHSLRNQPDVQKALQMTGSYLLLSPAHTLPTELDKELPKDPMLDGEPDVIYDDVSYRNIKQANSVKVIDPQPPFGIPLGPTTQSSPNDYLHLTPKENYRPKMISRKQPDTTMDDLAFRNLRREQRDQRSKDVNVSELDELLSEVSNDSPVHRRKSFRSVSADRAKSSKNDEKQIHTQEKSSKIHTPRWVKQHYESRRAGRFTESVRDAVTDVESVNTSPLSSRHNPSWLERANLMGSKWDNLSTNNLSTSTETLTDISSARAVSQPDIRQAIIREARAPPGGPSNYKVSSELSLLSSGTSAPLFKPISVPKLVKVQTIQSAPVSPIIVEKRPYRPLDSIFNNKPKPFYLSDNKNLENQSKQSPVDIAKLDALISTLSKIEKPEDALDVPEDTFDASAKQSESENDMKFAQSFSPLPTEENQAQSPLTDNLDDERLFAKANIQKAIKLSMAIESSSSEGKRVFCRRRSAIELPVYDNEPSYTTSSLPSTNISNCLNFNTFSCDFPKRTYSEIATVSDFLPVPVSASTFTDRIEPMIVTSQIVHDRYRRAHSVPASPRMVEDGHTLNNVFEKNASKISTDSEGAVRGFEYDSMNKLSKIQLSTGKLDSLVDQSPFQSASNDNVRKSDLITGSYINYKSRNACEKLSLSSPKSSDRDLFVMDAASDMFETDRREKSSNIPGGSDEEIFQTLSAEAPLPPKRSSSLPPSPSRRHFSNFSSYLSDPPLTSYSADRWFKCSQGYRTTRRTSLPVSESNNYGSSSESDNRNTLIRAGSLPPLSSRLPKDDNKILRSRGQESDSESLSYSSGEETSECSSNYPWTHTVLAACYLLACLTQMAGVDIVTAFGLLLAIASMFVTIAL